MSVLKMRQSSGDALYGSVAAVVPAAGLGVRFDRHGRKLFMPLLRQPLLAHTLRRLQASASIHWIQVVARPKEHKRIRALIRRQRITKALPVCAGAGSRSASVARGIAALPKQARWVLVHDGARPCITRGVIERTLRAAKKTGAAACGLPASVTVKSADKQGRVKQTLNRSALWFIQTPQAFRRDIIVRSLARAGKGLKRFPDDAALVEKAGYPVQLVLGDPLNIKVTTREDLLFAQAILKSRA